MFEMSIFYSRLISFFPYYILWARWAQSRPSAGGNWLKRRWLPQSWGSGWAFYNLPAQGRGTDSSLTSVRTDTVIKCPSQLDIIRGNFTFTKHFEATSSIGCLLESPFAPNLSSSEQPHEERDIRHGTVWAQVTRKALCTWLLLSQWFKMWIAAMGRRMSSCSSPCIAQHHSSCMAKPFCTSRDAGPGGCTSPTQGIQLLWRELEMSVENGNTNVHLHFF